MSANDLINVGVVGVGTIGDAVCEALDHSKIRGKRPKAILNNINPTPYDSLAVKDIAAMLESCDIIVEALPPEIVPSIAIPTLQANKTLILITSGALMTYPDILKTLAHSEGRILVPYGALLNVPEINALKNIDISQAQITSTKPPSGFGLDKIESPRIMFEGSATDAVAKYGKNANVGVSVALAARLAGHAMRVKIIADPAATGNTHHIEASGPREKLDNQATNKPSKNPKTSQGTAASVIDCLRDPANAMVELDAKAARYFLEINNFAPTIEAA